MEDILPVADIVRRLHELNPNGVPKSRWHTDNKEHVQSYIKEWQRDHPEQVSIYRKPKDHRRRMRERNGVGSFTSQEWVNLTKAYHNRCAYCKKRTKLTVDHIIPLTREGTSNWPSNLQLLCPFCNQSKHNKTHEEYLEYLAKKAQVVA